MARQNPRHDLHDELIIVLLICGATLAVVIGLAMRASWTEWHNLVVLICLTAIGVAAILSRRPRPDDTTSPRMTSSGSQSARHRDTAELPGLPDFGEIGDIIDIVR